MKENYTINSRVVMKKPHACGSNEWLVTRVGVDIKLKCIACNREIMLERLDFEKKVKKILGDNRNDKN